MKINFDRLAPLGNLMDTTWNNLETTRQHMEAATVEHHLGHLGDNFKTTCDNLGPHVDNLVTFGGGQHMTIYNTKLKNFRP